MFVGHDIGLMVAFAYAQAYRDEVSQLVVVDAPLPGTASSTGCAPTRGSGTSPSTARATSPRCSSPAASGQYLQAFFDARSYVPIYDADLDVYVSAYSAPGAMRAGFELYRAFDRDAADNRAALERDGKLTVPGACGRRRDQHHPVRSSRR